MLKTKRKAHTSELRRGILIKMERAKRGFTQSDIAAWINAQGYNLKITQERISAIERGADMGASELFAIADCLGIEIGELRCFN